MKKGFEGFLHFNDSLYAERVDFYSTGFSLHFGATKRPTLLGRSVGVYPMPATALVRDTEMMRAGFYYSVAGTDVGGCSEGPLGHPGDGESRGWPVLEFTIAAKYTYEMLTLGLSGRTGKGAEYVRGKRGLDLSTQWTFRAEVRIPREAIAEALKLPDAEKYALYERLELCR